MAFNTKAIIPWIQAKLIAVPGMQHVQRGEPLSPPATMNAYVMVAGQQPTRKYVGGQWQRAGRYLVMFVVRVENEEDDAEDLLADAYDSIENALLSDPTAGGLGSSVELDTSPADSVEYRRMYGPEFRIYPFFVIVTQNARITPT